MRFTRVWIDEAKIFEAMAGAPRIEMPRPEPPEPTTADFYKLPRHYNGHSLNPQGQK